MVARAMWCAVCAAVAILLAAGCTSSGTSATGTTTDYSDDPASLLAQRDGATDVAPYAHELDVLQTNCTENRVTVAGYVDATFSDEQKHGVTADSSRYDVLRHLVKAAKGSAPMKCNELAAAYLVLVEK